MQQLIYGDLKVRIEYDVNDGFLEIRMQPYQAYYIIEHFKNEMKHISRIEGTKPCHFMTINRMSRMCWELITYSRLTNIDMEDIRLLYTIDQNSNTSWIHEILNEYILDDKIKNNEYPVLVADRFAKDFANIMDS